MAHDLVGAWGLESWSLEYEDGRPSEFPLGLAVRGMLLYTSDGCVSHPPISFFSIMQCTPLLPSTVWVMCRSPLRLHSM